MSKSEVFEPCYAIPRKASAWEKSSVVPRRLPLHLIVEWNLRKTPLISKITSNHPTFPVATTRAGHQVKPPSITRIITRCTFFLEFLEIHSKRCTIDSRAERNPAHCRPKKYQLTSTWVGQVLERMHCKQLLNVMCYTFSHISRCLEDQFIEIRCERLHLFRKHKVSTISRSKNCCTHLLNLSQLLWPSAIRLHAARRKQRHWLQLLSMFTPLWT